MTVSNRELARLRFTSFTLAATGICRRQFAKCEGVGWVAENGGCMAGCAQPLEKSAFWYTSTLCEKAAITARLRRHI